MSWENIVYFLFWAGLFAVMMRFGCGARVMGHRHRHGASGNDGPESTAPPDRSYRNTETEQTTDPVCGRRVEVAQAKSAVYQGQACYFCSAACRDKFEAAPASYVRARTGVSTHKEHHHGCC